MLRILWAYRLTSVRIAVAAQIFLQAGVLLLYLLNLLLVKRIWSERLGAEARLQKFLGLLSGFTVASLVMVVVSIIVSVYTLDERVIHQCREIQRAGATYYVIVAVMPIPLLAIAASPSSRKMRLPKLGSSEGGMSGRSIEIPVLVSTLLCVINAGFKDGVVLAPARPLLDPAWYHSPACMYIFVFTTELCVLLMFYFVRVDLLFQFAGRIESGSDGGIGHHGFDTRNVSLT